MKKTLTKILLISIILLWFLNKNQTNAEDLGGFESLFWEVNNEFSCDSINYDIKRYYSSYKYKVDIPKRKYFPSFSFFIALAKNI